MIPLAVAAAAALMPARLHAQAVMGRALDDATGAPVGGVAIELLDSTSAIRATSSTDTAGWFRVRAPAGTMRLRARLIGYADVESQRFVVEHGAVIELEIRLRPEAVALEPVRVVAERRYSSALLAEYFARAERVRRTGFGRVYTRDELERSKVFYVSHLPELAMARPDCPLTYLLNGAPITPGELDTTVQVEDVEGVEIYRSRAQVPPEYLPRAGCGLVLVWSRVDMPDARPLAWVRGLLFGAGVAALVVLFHK